MAFDLGYADSSSTATTKINTVSDSGQLNEKSQVAQSGGVVIGKGAKLAPDFSKGKLKNSTVTINNGPSADLLQSLSLAQPARQSVTEPAPTTVAANESQSNENPTTLNQLFDAAKNNPLILGVIVIGLIAAVRIFRKG